MLGAESAVGVVGSRKMLPSYLAKTEEMKELREAAAILQELEKLRHPGEAAPGGGVVELG